MKKSSERIKKLCDNGEIDRVVRKIESILAMEVVVDDYYEFLALIGKWSIFPMILTLKALEP